MKPNKTYIMKLIIFFSFISLILISCNNSPKCDNPEITEGLVLSLIDDLQKDEDLAPYFYAYLADSSKKSNSIFEPFFGDEYIAAMYNLANMTNKDDLTKKVAHLADSLYNKKRIYLSSIITENINTEIQKCDCQAEFHVNNLNQLIKYSIQIDSEGEEYVEYELIE